MNIATNTPAYCWVLLWYYRAPAVATYALRHATSSHCHFFLQKYRIPKQQSRYPNNI